MSGTGAPLPGPACAPADSGAFVYGTPEEIAARLAECGRAGGDEVVVDVAGVYSGHGRPDAVRDLRDILTACRERKS